MTFNHIRDTDECKSMQRYGLRFTQTHWCIFPGPTHYVQKTPVVSVEVCMTARSVPYDRLVVSTDERRPAVLDVIRQARRRITLSLFRCNDAAVFEELKAAADRGVEVEVLVTSRAKGGEKKMAKLWRALEQTGASLHSYTDPVVKYHPKYLVVDED